MTPQREELCWINLDGPGSSQAHMLEPSLVLFSAKPRHLFRLRTPNVLAVACRTSSYSRVRTTAASHPRIPLCRWRPNGLTTTDRCTPNPHTTATHCFHSHSSAEPPFKAPKARNMFWSTSSHMSSRSGPRTHPAVCTSSDLSPSPGQKLTVHMHEHSSAQRSATVLTVQL